jgi:hypothetical protein
LAFLLPFLLDSEPRVLGWKPQWGCSERRRPPNALPSPFPFLMVATPTMRLLLWPSLLLLKEAENNFLEDVCVTERNRSLSSSRGTDSPQTCETRGGMDTSNNV